MSSTLNPAQSEFSVGQWATNASVDPSLRPADLRDYQFPNKRPSLSKPATHSVARFLIAFFIGVAAASVWQSYSDAVREMIASSSPQLRWLAPQVAPLAQTTPDIIATIAPFQDQRQLKAISLDLAGVRQSVDQLAAGQEQMTRDITKLQAAEQDILGKIISAPLQPPAAVSARKPSPRPSQVR